MQTPTLYDTDSRGRGGNGGNSFEQGQSQGQGGYMHQQPPLLQHTGQQHGGFPATQYHHQQQQPPPRSGGQGWDAYTAQQGECRPHSMAQASPDAYTDEGVLCPPCTTPPHAADTDKVCGFGLDCFP